MKNETLSQLSFYLSVLAVVLALVGALGVDIWLASTQWVVVAAVLGVWAIFFKN
ncbi:hypothetical protein J7K05_02145 [bacterium]|nr:hypothetical protein [bacterium]